MQQTCYLLKKDAFLTPIPCDSLPERFAEGEDDYWLEIESATNDELTEVVKSHNLHPLLVEDILNPEHSTLIDGYPRAIYIEFPTNFDEDNDSTAYLSIIVTAHLIITIRRGNVSGMEKLLDYLLHEFRLPMGRTIAVLYFILDNFIDTNMVTALKIRNRVDTLEEAFAVNPEELSLATTMQLKQQLRVLTNIGEDQRFIVLYIKNIHTDAMDYSGYESYILDLGSNTEQLLRSLERTEERVVDLQKGVQLTMQGASDKRLRILTIISAVFLPMTLLTGFFGMNFKGMILLEWRYGFTVFLVFMIFILFGMSWYFYREGWFE